MTPLPAGHHVWRVARLRLARLFLCELYKNVEASVGDSVQRVGHEFERAAHRRPVGRAAEADAHGFRRRAVGGEGVARHDPNAGRAHMADERRAGPRLRQRQPEMKAERIGAVASGGRIACASACRSIVSAHGRKSASAVPSSIQRVASATVTGEAITVAVRTAAANSQPQRASGATT